MNKGVTYYLAGPMTGYPQFNFPAFYHAARTLRERGYTIVTPTELDSNEVVIAALQSKNGEIRDLPRVETWGDMLSRDVKIIADECGGVILLSGWEKSKGAKLEAFVGLLCTHAFAEFLTSDALQPISNRSVLSGIWGEWRSG